jgi:hypothetical protein
MATIAQSAAVHADVEEVGLEGDERGEWVIGSAHADSDRCVSRTTVVVAPEQPLFSIGERIALVGSLGLLRSDPRRICARSADARRLVSTAQAAQVPGLTSSRSDARTSNASAATWKPAAGYGRPSHAACAQSPASIGTPVEKELLEHLPAAAMMGGALPPHRRTTNKSRPSPHTKGYDILSPGT